MGLFCVATVVYEEIMILDMQIAPEGHSTVTQTSDLGAFKDEIPPIAKPVTCIATIDRHGATSYIQVEFTAQVELSCSRCLSTYEQPIAGTFRLTIKEDSSKFGASKEDDLVEYYFNSRNSQVDITPTLYDEIVLELPLKPLCAESCSGIDIAKRVDGKEATGQIDPRWEALRTLKK